jgi:hypothetical protein
MADQPDSFAAIDAAYTAIEAAFPDAYAAASPADQPAILAARNAARDARDAALGKLFAQADPDVTQLTAALSDAVDQMNADLDGLKQVGQFLKLAATAANTAAQLAKLAV